MDRTSDGPRAHSGVDVLSFNVEEAKVNWSNFDEENLASVFPHMTLLVASTVESSPEKVFLQKLDLYHIKE